MKYSEQVKAAFTLAYDLHREQERKGSGVPYITHLMAVAGIVGEFGGDEEQFVAALLHDAAEDQGGHDTLDLIREQFGARVAVLVHACSDSLEAVEEKAPWRQRKEEHIAHTREAPEEVRLILAADKLHNARSILADHDRHGDAVWKRFKGGREGTQWYYEQMRGALNDGWEHPILEALGRTVEDLVALR